MVSKRFRKRPGLVAGVVISLVVALAGPAFSAPGGWHGLGWDLPALQQTSSVPGTGNVMRSVRASATQTNVMTEAPAVAWPTAASATVSLPATSSLTGAMTAAAGTPVSVSASTSAAVTVDLYDQDLAVKAGVHGILARLTSPAPLRVRLDYSKFANAYGADYGRRLRMFSYPECVLSTPDNPSCRASTPLNSVNNAKDQSVEADVRGSSVVALDAGPSSDGGDFTASSLSPTGTWTASGDFGYRYPFVLPTPPVGSAPAVGLSYSSDAVDGATSATNNQASWVGDGWSLSANGFIERAYKACAGDLGGNNGQTKTGDLCWGSDNATMALAGASGRLVKDKTSGAWHPRDDDGSKVERLYGADNGAKDGEYWKVTKTDGTQYLFGLNHLPGYVAGNANTPETSSVFTVPVYGNNTGEPCHQATLAASSCVQAWRWNLDYIVDPHGNATAFFYQPEINYYGQNMNTTTAGSKYTRGGFLARIEYGMNTRVSGGSVYGNAPDRVVFDPADRCLLSNGSCTSFPDAPNDLVCAENAACRSVSPAFFSRKRLATVTTQVANGSGGWNSANRWTLSHSFPQTGDGSSAALWLDGVRRTGLAGTAIDLPPTTFGGTAMANRTHAGTGYTSLTRSRLTSIVGEAGGSTTISYTAPDCQSGNPEPAANTSRCYPVYWTPGGATAPRQDWFNKFLVTDVYVDGRTSLSTQTRTHYDYVDGAAWHFDENFLADPKYRTYSQWRGYSKVVTTSGQPNDPAGPPTVTRAQFMRGMNTPVVNELHESIIDSQQFDGQIRESLTYLDGRIIGGSVNDFWTSTATATDADGIQSFVTGVSATRARTWIDTTGTWRDARTATTFNDHGLTTSVETAGDLTDPAQTTCARTGYAENAGAWMFSYVQSTQTVAGPCTADNPAASGNIISDVRTSYDSLAFGTAPTVGDATAVDDLDTWPSTGAETFVHTARSTFDLYGRIRTVADALNRTTTTTYTPGTGGPVTQVAIGRPPVTIGGNPVSLTSTRTLDPVTGVLTATVDESGRRTQASYDALARVKAVWQPGHAGVSGMPADSTYDYAVSAAGPSVVTTRQLRNTGLYSTSYAIIDGTGKSVQTQSPTPYASGGRVITDTLYDTQGRVWRVHLPYWNNAAPATSLLVVQDNAVPHTDVNLFDSANRTVATVYQKLGAEQWRTTTRYGGDRTTTIPPDDAVASTVVSNGLGQQTQLLRYRDPAHTAVGDAADATTYTYYPSGRLATVTDSTGRNVWRYDYDAHGRVARQTDPDAGTSTTTYDPAGQPTSTMDGRGQVLVYQYDALGRLTGEYDTTVSSDKRLVAWTYDTLVPGLLSSTVRYVAGKPYVSAPTGYDAGGRPSGTTLTVPSGETGLSGTYTFGTSYDQYTGLVRSTTSPAVGGLPAETVFHAYNGMDLPSTSDVAGEAGGFTVVAETDYDPLGQILRVNLADANDPRQVSTTNTYESGTNRLATTVTVRATATSAIVLNRAYSYNNAGAPYRVADTPQTSAGDTQCFRYDQLARLSDAWTPTSGDCTAGPEAKALGGAAPYWQSWTFDESGNRKTQTDHGAAADRVTTSTYPAAGSAQPHTLRTTTTVSGPAGAPSTNSYSFDPGGHAQTARGHTLTYDAEGRIATDKDPAGKQSSYVYDADGARLLTRDPTGTTLTMGDVELFVPAGSNKAHGSRRYEHGGQSVGQVTDGVRTWTLADDHGTGTASVDAASLAVTNRYQDPFGNPRGPQPTAWPDRHGFVGGYQDTSSLVNLGAREYDPSTGSFLSADPILEPQQPQQLNAYAYANHNPAAGSDATGLYCDGCDFQDYNRGKHGGPGSHVGCSLATDGVCGPGRDNDGGWKVSHGQNKDPKKQPHIGPKRVPTFDELKSGAFTGVMLMAKPGQSYAEAVYAWANFVCQNDYNNHEAGFCSAADDLGIIHHATWLDAVNVLLGATMLADGAGLVGGALDAGASAAAAGARAVTTALDEPAAVARTFTSTDQHVALGLDGDSLESFASKNNAQTLMNDLDWRGTVWTAAHLLKFDKPGIRISFNLDNMYGVENGVKSVVDRSLLRNARQIGGLTDLELVYFHDVGTLGKVDFYIGGIKQPNPF